MKKSFAALLGVVLVFFASSSPAQDTSARDEWNTLSAEEKQAYMDKAKENWQDLSDEEKRAVLQKAKKNWKGPSPEKKEGVKKNGKEKRAKKEHKKQ